MHDVCIVGAGPAGLNAALILGRCGRDVLVYDSGQPRNAASQGLHGYLTRDGMHPKELRSFGRQEVAKYPSVRFEDAEVVRVQPEGDHFVVEARGRAPTHARIVLLATGRVDEVPHLPGFREYYGRGVYHCPYCDGWEHKGEKIVAYGACPDVVHLALALLTWSPHVTACPANPAELSQEHRALLRDNGVELTTTPVTHVSGVSSGELSAIHLQDGTTIPCQALFFTAELHQKAPFAEQLGCEMDEGGSVICQEHAATGVRGLYVAGNVRRGVHLAIMAAAEGAEAAIAINNELAERGLRR